MLIVVGRLLTFSKRLHAFQPHRAALALPALYMGVIFILSSVAGTALPPDTSPTVEIAKTIIHNGAHIPLFALLAWLWCWSLAGWNITLRRRIMLAFSLTTLYGGIDEWHQSFTPGRDASALDFMLDMLGAYIAVCFYYGQSQKS